MAAENPADGDSSHSHAPGHYQLTSRRVSFRKSLSETALPDSYLEILESKRKQLDESIHKYIASKEREYKNFEKDIKTQYRTTVSSGAVSPNQSSRAALDGEAQEHGGPIHKRRTSSESTILSAQGDGQYNNARVGSALDALMTNGVKHRRESTSVVDDEDDLDESYAERKAAAAGLVDRRASSDREREFVGLFTPHYLVALDEKASRSPGDDISTGKTQDKHSSSSPVEQSTLETTTDLAFTESQSVVTERAPSPAKPKRPSQIQLTSRTSSSGSSADGRLTSAMKSPAATKERPKRKRVSLAVGDSIVAPSDSVPTEQASASRTPSHSRVRTSAPIRLPPIEGPADGTAPSGFYYEAAEADVTESLIEASIATGTISSTGSGAGANEFPFRLERNAPGSTSRDRAAASFSKSRVDPDGDFFHLDEDLEDDYLPDEMPKLDDQDDDDVHADVTGANGNSIAGRVGLDHTKINRPRSDNAETTREHDGRRYDAEAGLLTDDEDQYHDDAVQSDDDVDEDDVHVGFHPGSASASQQPTKPGFRRPSVTADPVFRGEIGKYVSAEARAVEGGLYGSAYSGPVSRPSSFRGGSLGASFMERNAEGLVRERAASTAATTTTGSAG